MVVCNSIAPPVCNINNHQVNMYENIVIKASNGVRRKDKSQTGVYLPRGTTRPSAVVSVSISSSSLSTGSPLTGYDSHVPISSGASVHCPYTA